MVDGIAATQLRAAISSLDPGYFALVMATGIVSQAMSLDGAVRLSGILLGAGICAYLLLAAAYAGRLAGYRSGFLADARDPRRAFGYLTLPAASDVLAARLADDNHPAAAAVLLVIGGVCWALLGYGLPLLLAGRGARRPALAGANGTWFMPVVATQSIAVALTSSPSRVPGPLAAVAVGCWATGVMLYLIIAVLVAGVLLAFPVRAADLAPAYWVTMGAAAISVLAGAQILRLPAGPLQTAVHPLVAGVSVVLWAFGTWLIPLLVTVGVWRHVRRRVPLAYEPGLWSMVFPVGMYGVGSHELGAALGVSWLVTLGRDEAWLALAAWVAVALMMAGALLRPVRRRTPV